MSDSGLPGCSDVGVTGWPADVSLDDFKVQSLPKGSAHVSPDFQAVTTRSLGDNGMVLDSVGSSLGEGTDADCSSNVGGSGGGGDVGDVDGGSGSARGQKSASQVAEYEICNGSTTVELKDEEGVGVSRTFSSDFGTEADIYRLRTNFIPGLDMILDPLARKIKISVRKSGVFDGSWSNQTPVEGVVSSLSGSGVGDKDEDTIPLHREGVSSDSKWNYDDRDEDMSDNEDDFNDQRPPSKRFKGSESANHVVSNDGASSEDVGGRTQQKCADGGIYSMDAISPANDDEGLSFGGGASNMAGGSRRGLDYDSISLGLSLPGRTRNRKSLDGETVGSLCLECVKSLMSLPEAIPFNRPVDPERDGAPNYFLVISNPMDLKTVREMLKSNSIANLRQFVKEVNQIWSNAFQYNSEFSPICQQARYLSQVFESEMQGIEKQILRVYPSLCGGSSVSSSSQMADVGLLGVAPGGGVDTRTAQGARIDRREQEVRLRLEAQIRQLKETLKKLNQRMNSLSSKKGVYQALQHLQRSERQNVVNEVQPVVKTRSSMPANTSSMNWVQKFAVYKALQWVSANHHRYLQYLKCVKAKQAELNAAIGSGEDGATGVGEQDGALGPPLVEGESNGMDGGIEREFEGVELVNHIVPLVEIIEEEQPELLDGLSSEVILDLDLISHVFSRRIEEYLAKVPGVSSILQQEYTLEQLREEIAAHSGYESESAVAEDDYFFEEEEEEEEEYLPNSTKIEIDLEDDGYSLAAPSSNAIQRSILNEQVPANQKNRCNYMSDSSSDDSDDSDSSDTDSEASFDRSHHSIIVPTSPIAKELGVIIDKSWDMSDLEQQPANLPATVDVGSNVAMDSVDAMSSSTGQDHSAIPLSSTDDVLWSNYRKISAIKTQMSKEKTELEEKQRKEREEKELNDKKEEERLKAAADEETLRLKKEAEHKRGFELMQKREQEKLIREQKKQQMLQENN